ncbi:uncharacterized protein LOC126746235 [Anthonomus grandis grandis]|uniref:uncharacterized protein LOC126746235 n=1 Tax=Anthonomus grandis grandis TaxID=2921223 RepID=UPI0021668F1E|nr:uncharacterized protein LOC126746235 [Anthonomus grandis grandis]XP_050310347.1 uncharacterized protein LOC126746235 [Anthonomus grandis grandis]
MDFSSSKVQKQDRPKFSLLHLLFLNSISLFFIIIFSIVFFIYTIILNIYLKLKIGKSYGGVVPPRDLIFFLPDVSVCHITTVAYARCDKKIDMVKRVKEIIQEKIFDFPDNYPKLTSSTHSFHGYYFTKKYDCNVNDVVKEIHLDKNKELTEEFLKKYTAKVTNAEFGKNGSVLWDIHVGPCPIKETQNGVYRYPIISRFHHSIADGTSLVNLIIHVFGDKGCENYGKKIFEKVLKKQSSGKQRKSFSEWVEANVVNLIKMTSVYMELLFVSAGKYVAKSHLRSQDVNALHGKLLTGEKLCAWVAEDTVECIPMVKRIKNKTKTQFMCVVSTAVAASLSNYFKRNDLPIPEDMSGLIAVLLDYPDV